MKRMLKSTGIRFLQCLAMAAVLGVWLEGYEQLAERAVRNFDLTPLLMIRWYLLPAAIGMLFALPGRWDERNRQGRWTWNVPKLLGLSLPPAIVLAVYAWSVWGGGTIGHWLIGLPDLFPSALAAITGFFLVDSLEKRSAGS